MNTETDDPRTVNVLLVDDDTVDRKAVRRAFTKARLANPITEAVDGVAALEILRGTDETPPLDRPFIILLDVNMPRMNGLEFLAEIRQDEKLKDSVVFMLTTSADDQDRLAAYDHHVAGYIVKSAVGQDFMKVVTMLDAYWRVVALP